MLRCRLLGGGRRFGVHGGGEGRGHTVAAARLQLVSIVLIAVVNLICIQPNWTDLASFCATDECF